MAIKWQNIFISHTVPGQPTITTSPAIASISVQWRIPQGSEVDLYNVMWESQDCPGDVDEGHHIMFNGNSYIIANLRDGTSYTITVMAVNSVGHVSSNPQTAKTTDQRE